MRDKASVPANCGYVLTDAGRAALREPWSCECKLVVQGRNLVCPDCGTLYSFPTGSHQPAIHYGEKRS